MSHTNYYYNNLNSNIIPIKNIDIIKKIFDCNPYIFLYMDYNQIFF